MEPAAPKGCAAGQRCNFGTGICEQGCENGSDAECPQPGFCEVSSKTCRCAPGTHLCGNTCVSNDSVNSCGARCMPCSAPNGGIATCDGTTCGIQCPDPLVACGNTCAACPAGATATACEGERCVATACPSGSKLCNGACSLCPTNAASTACQGSTCVAASCRSGEHVCSGECVSNSDRDTCGTRCTPCPSPSDHGYADCASGQCKTICYSGYTNCGTECVTCPTDGVATTTCSGNACVPATCSAGRKLCGTTCSVCPEGATATTCVSGKCTATACGVGFTLSNGTCKGLKTTAIEGLALNSPVGVAHNAAGTPTIAYDHSHYGGGLRTGDWTGTSTINAVNHGGSDARDLSLRIAPDGTAHLVYLVKPFNRDNSLRHAWRAPGSTTWQTEDILVSPGILLQTALAVTAQGDLRVLVLNYLGSGVLYFEKNGSTWSAPVVVPGLSNPKSLDIAVDAQGVSHIVAAEAGIRYASGTLTTLTAGPIVTTAQNAKSPSIVVTSTGEVKVVFYQQPSIHLATLGNGTWSTAAIPNVTANLDSPTDLAVDGSDRLHLVFTGCGQPGCGLRYGILDSGTWWFQTALDPNGFSISPTHLAISVTPAGVAAVMASEVGDGATFFHP